CCASVRGRRTGALSSKRRRHAAYRSMSSPWRMQPRATSTEQTWCSFVPISILPGVAPSYGATLGQLWRGLSALNAFLAGQENHGVDTVLLGKRPPFFYLGFLQSRKRVAHHRSSRQANL